MIKIENTIVSGFAAAVRGMRNPKNSWAKSDSEFPDGSSNSLHIGDNDYSLMKTLVQSGTDHSKFMRMIIVSMDVVAPFYWWKEADTYKVGTVADSCSTMHKLLAKPFELEDFSFDAVDAHCFMYKYDILDWLNTLREEYLASDDENEKKVIWKAIVQLLPESYNQRRTMLLNYAVLRNMYHARKNHKLTEWHDFCRWIESLPYSELITM